ncbi:MAG: hypothetical protein ISS79_02565 [Phycisphaerae bacterium]|nr:hypothetical protein [Phycisphaerae bacterium]
MTQDQIENLLKQADRTAGPPAPVSVNLSALRRRASRRRAIATAASLAAAAVLIAAIGILSRTTETQKTHQPQQRIAKIEDQIKHLQATTDAALKLIGEVLEDDRKQRRLGALHAQLESIPDPLEEIRKDVDKTAFNLVYQADRLYYELNLTGSAVDAYKQVITLFPKNQWADVARERLADIERSRLKKPNSKGDLKWKLQNAPPYC